MMSDQTEVNIITESMSNHKNNLEMGERKQKLEHWQNKQVQRAETKCYNMHLHI